MSLALNPGKGLGIFLLGASIFETLGKLKTQQEGFPKIEISHDANDPFEGSIVVVLPENGLRLRFDGQEQRLRLVEVLDFSKISITYKNLDMVKATPDSLMKRTSGPAFKQIYHRLLGPTYPGEFIPSKSSNSDTGLYVLSYPGVAFSFPLSSSTWFEKADFVSLLSSPNASPAKSMAVFTGSSWSDASKDYLSSQPPHARASWSVKNATEDGIDEIEMLNVKSNRVIEVVRRTTAPFSITLGETTPQDLVAELGPPSAIYRKSDRRLSIHKRRPRGHQEQYTEHTTHDQRLDIDRLSLGMDESDSDESSSTTGRNSKLSDEFFYNYFHHGLDLFVTNPSKYSAGSTSDQVSLDELVVTKVIIHGNLPGSHDFDRYRRCRWKLDPIDERSLNSETPFRDIAMAFDAQSGNERFRDQKPMILDRAWGDSPSSSVELLGGLDDTQENIRTDIGMELGNTELFGYPGYLFEVLQSGYVATLTVY